MIQTTGVTLYLLVIVTILPINISPYNWFICLLFLPISHIINLFHHIDNQIHLKKMTSKDYNYEYISVELYMSLLTIGTKSLQPSDSQVIYY